MMFFNLNIQNYKDWGELLQHLKNIIEEKNKTQIVTLNPEMLVCAQKDTIFFNILKKSLLIPDGFGIILASKILGKSQLKRYPGVEIIEQMLQSDLFIDCSFYFFGASQKTLKRLAFKIQSKSFKDSHFVGFHPGEIDLIYRLRTLEKFYFNKIKNKKTSETQALDLIDYTTPTIVNKINKAKPDVLFVALGSPLQEKWIYYNLPKLNSVKLAIGVGGAFDILSGLKPRAPLFLRRLGLEWVWRLSLEPKRMKRIYNATFKFFWIVLNEVLKKYQKKLE